MKAFTLSSGQIAAIIAALIVDELGARFGRHVDSMSGAAWGAKTGLDGEMSLSADERESCDRRVRAFFCIRESSLPALVGETIGDWAEAVREAIENNLDSFTFTAAGDDGEKFIHGADAIFSDAAGAANLLYGRRRVLSLVAPHSLMGFVLTILAPNLLQIPALDVRTMTPDELRAALAYGDALIATPSLWRYITREGVAGPDNAMGVFFGEPMAPELSADMRKAGFGAQRELYGSTQTGLIGWRDSPGEAFVLFDQWRRESDGLFRRKPDGEMVEREPMDLLTWTGERRFSLGGRRDGAAQIGAVNVFPVKIAAKIAEHPSVASCVVSVSRHADGADRLIASIRLKTAGAPSETVARSIDSWCRASLRPHERPRVYNFEAAVG